MSEASRATVCGKYSRPVILMKDVRNTEGGAKQHNRTGIAVTTLERAKSFSRWATSSGGCIKSHSRTLNPEGGRIQGRKIIGRLTSTEIGVQRTCEKLNKR